MRITPNSHPSTQAAAAPTSGTPTYLQVKMKTEPPKKQVYMTPPQKIPKITKQDPNLKSLKQKLHYLFVYYCEYSNVQGSIFIRQSSLVKLLKDAQILPQKHLTEKDLSIIIIQELRQPTISAIDFQSFLNILVRVAVEIPYEQDGIDAVKSQKEALQKMLSYYILPLLATIEHLVRSAQDTLYKHGTTQTNSGQTIPALSIQQMMSIEACSSDDLIFQSIKPTLITIYSSYFVPPQAQSPNAIKQLLRCLKDMDVSPYLLPVKSCFMIYYFSTLPFSDPLVDHFDSIMEIRKKQLVSQNQDLSFAQFVSILMRVAIIYYDITVSSTPGEDPLVSHPRKLLTLLNRMELSAGFQKFQGNQRLMKNVSNNHVLTPPRATLVQIYLAQNNIESDPDFNVDAIDAYQLSKFLTEQPQIVPEKRQLVQKQEKLVADVMRTAKCELDDYICQVEDELIKVFQMYCAIGDPTNTTKLKSARVLRMFREAGLLKKTDTLKTASQYGSVREVSHGISSTQLDIIFKKVCLDVEHKGSFLDVNRYSTAGGEYQTGLNTSFSALTQISPRKKLQTNQDLHYQSPRKVHQYLLFDQFKEFLIGVASDIWPNTNPYEQTIFLIRENILPLGQQQAKYESRSVLGAKSQTLLSKMNDPEIDNVLQTLQQSLTPFYGHYSDHKGLAEFDDLLRFCSDFGIFPDVITKSDLHRIFQLLLGKADVSKLSQSIRRSSVSPARVLSSAYDSTIKTPYLGKDSQRQDRDSITISEFILALGMAALCLDHSAFRLLLEPEYETFEKVMIFIEKLSQAEGPKKLKRKQASEVIKSNTFDRVDILRVFQKKYGWYFKQRVEDSPKKRQVVRSNALQSQYRSSMVLEKGKVDLFGDLMSEL